MSKNNKIEIKKWFKSNFQFKSTRKKSLTETHQTLVQHEKHLMISPIFVLPSIFIAIFLISLSFQDFPYGVVISIIIIPLLIYFMVQKKSSKSDKTSHKIKEKSNKYSSEGYFRKIGYENATVRYHSLNIYLRYYLLIVIIILALVSLGLYLINQDEVNRKNTYDKELEEYNQVREKFASMTDVQIEDELKKTFLLKDEYQLQNIAVEKEYQKIVGSIGKNETEIDYQERNTIENQAIDIVREYPLEEIKSNVIKDIELMTPMQMRIALDKETEQMTPRYFPSWNIKWQQNFLISSVFTVGMIFISLFLFKIFLTRKKDFYYHLALSCFKTYQKFQTLEQEQKRNYVTWGLDFYNGYVKTNYGKCIHNLDQLQSQIIIQPITSIDGIANNVLEKLEINDRLELFRNLSTIIENQKIVIDLIDDKQSLFEKLKERISLIVVLIPLISVIVSLIKDYVNFK